MPRLGVQYCHRCLTDVAETPNFPPSGGGCQSNTVRPTLRCIQKRTVTYPVITVSLKCFRVCGSHSCLPAWPTSGVFSRDRVWIVGHWGGGGCSSSTFYTLTREHKETQGVCACVVPKDTAVPKTPNLCSRRACTPTGGLSQATPSRRASVPVG